MALGSTQPQTEMSTRNLPDSKGRPARKAENLIAICEPAVQKIWEPQRLVTLWASTACYRDSFTFKNPWLMVKLHDTSGLQSYITYMSKILTKQDLWSWKSAL
jgi:hypothetical protein